MYMYAKIITLLNYPFIVQTLTLIIEARLYKTESDFSCASQAPIPNEKASTSFFTWMSRIKKWIFPLVRHGRNEC